MHNQRSLTLEGEDVPFAEKIEVEDESADFPIHHCWFEVSREDDDMANAMSQIPDFKAKLMW